MKILKSKQPRADNNLTDTNGAPGAMDEDGAEDTQDLTDDVNGALGQAEDEEDDITPAIHKLSLHSYHPHGQAEVSVDVQAVVSGAAGMVQKRRVLTGSVTAKQLALALLDIANW